MPRNTTNDHDPSLLTIIDIETIVPDPPAGDGFPKWTRHLPVVASILTAERLAEGEYAFWLDSVIAESGRKTAFYDEVDALIPRGATTCGWNSAGFDFPVLGLGAIAARRFSAAKLSRHHRAHRYGPDHADLADLYSSRGAATRPSLAEVCGRLGVPVKVSSHGSHVADLYADGRLDEIRLYCEEDVAATAVCAWAWFAWRDGNDAILAEPLAAFSRWVEQCGFDHLTGIARCEPARWARRRALQLKIEHGRVHADRRIAQQRLKRLFTGGDPLADDEDETPPF